LATAEASFLLAQYLCSTQANWSLHFLD